MLRLLPAQEGLDDAHAAAAARTGILWRFWLFGLGVDSLDGIDRDWHCKQFADACDTLDAGLAREPTVITDAVEALRQDMHQEPADELVGIEHHQLVSLGTFDAVVLPPEGDGIGVGGDQSAVGDGDAMGVAREIAQDLLGPCERLLCVDLCLPIMPSERSADGDRRAK